MRTGVAFDRSLVSAKSEAGFHCVKNAAVGDDQYQPAVGQRSIQGRPAR
jgi:hypothetical protein